MARQSTVVGAAGRSHGLLSLPSVRSCPSAWRSVTWYSAGATAGAHVQATTRVHVCKCAPVSTDIRHTPSRYYDEIQLGRCLFGLLRLSCEAVPGFVTILQGDARTGTGKPTTIDHVAMLAQHPALPEDMQR